MDRWKSRGGKSQRREKVRRERVGTKKIKVREKVEKSRNIVFCSKSRLAKEAGAEPSGQMGNEKLHAAPAHFEAKMRKTPQVRNTFGSWHVQKVYAVVAPNTFSNSKCAKDRSPGTLLEVEMFKKCTPLWREANFEVKMMFKNCTPLWREANFEVKMRKPLQRNAFGSWDVQKMHATVAQSTFRLQNVQNTSAPEHFWKLRCSKSARRCGAKQISKSKYQKHHMLDHFWKLRCSKSARRCGAKHISKSKCWTRSDVVSQAQGILNLAKSEQIAKVLWQLQQRWQAWDVWRRSAKMHFACLAGAQGLQFGGSNLKSSGSLRCFLWQAQHFVWPGLTFSRQAQYFRQMSQQKRKTQWYEAVSSALNFPFLKEVWQNGFACDAVKF